uniref:Conantokin-Ca2 n=1 Tax=Conus caracteristicus TaxID=89440 RepID=CKC_CONCB|nr:RecName: Full=Conantokin-Ca2; Short=Con-Ca2 [Conus caracteristicus]
GYEEREIAETVRELEEA